MSYLKITPIDSLFFRDGSPFNAGEAGQMEVASVFPPNADTVVGALRAAFARAKGWQKGKWSKDIIALLGDGETLHPLNYAGPYLLAEHRCLYTILAKRYAKAAKDTRKSAAGQVNVTITIPSRYDTRDTNIPMLFPMPLHLLAAQDTENNTRLLTLLEPDSEARETDIGTVNLPKNMHARADDKDINFKPLDSAYLTNDGMKAILEGSTPKDYDMFYAVELWASDTRAGIARDNFTSVVREGQFYQSSHTRLRDGVSLAMKIEGYNGTIPKLATLGGESRMVSLEKLEAAPCLPKTEIQVQNDTIRYTVILLTPTKLADNNWCNPALEKKKLADLPGTIISACVGKPTLIGGWDSVKKEPKVLEPYLPAGSIFFMEAKTQDTAALKTALEKNHLSHIGQRTAWGYGQILIGNYPQRPSAS